LSDQSLIFAFGSFAAFLVKDIMHGHQFLGRKFEDIIDDIQGPLMLFAVIFVIILIKLARYLGSFFFGNFLEIPADSAER
jgi:hypothetical protein